jgi:hypothetical protein
MVETTGERAIATEPFELTPAQITYYQTFGFLKLPGVFTDDIERIREGFEEVFASEPVQLLDPANPYHRTRDPRYEHETRAMVPGFIDKSPKLQWLRDDPRTRAIAQGLLGDGYIYAESDGNLFNCDVYWHLDVYGATAGVEHIKISFYMDELRRDTGALRVIPGSQFEGTYARQLYRNLAHDPGRVSDNYGLSIDDIPSWTVEVTPGDVIVGNFRTMHGSFNGGVRRRLFTVNFSAASGEAAQT